MFARIRDMLGNFKGRVSIYSYRPGVSFGDLGVGTDGLALMKPFSDPINAPYNVFNTPKGQLRPYQGSYMPDGQQAVVTGLAHGGVFTGTIALQALADYQAGTNGNKS